VTLSPASNII